MTSLTLVRHAATRPNEEARFQGRLDIGLSPAGRRQARRLEPHLAHVDPDCGVFRVSDLRRARETAALAAPGRGWRQDSRLRELDFGPFDGRTCEENRDRHGRRFLDWLEDPRRHEVPGVESLTSLRSRLEDWLAEVGGAGTVVAVSHGGPIRMLLAVLLGVRFARLRSVPIPPATVMEVTSGSEGWSLAAVATVGEGDDPTRVVRALDDVRAGA